VTFTANIRETTCDMKIVGGTGNGKNNTITIGPAAKFVRTTSQQEPPPQTSSWQLLSARQV
jgi:hypothetical protein